MTPILNYLRMLLHSVPRKKLLTWICILCSLFILPNKLVYSLRHWVIGAFAPTWSFLQNKRNPSFPSDQKKLELENCLLLTQMERMKAWVLSTFSFQQELQKLLVFQKKEGDPFYQRREKYLKQILCAYTSSLPANVIFREPSTWSHFFWVDVGEEQNRELGRIVIQKDSPVVVGKVIVGVVDEVEKNRSRIRLITDENLILSVRAVRKGEQNKILFQKMDELIQILSLREDLPQAKEVASVLQKYQKTIPIDQKEIYLAKGELRGTSYFYNRKPKQKLQGTGFHYFFRDEEGEESSTIPPVVAGDVLLTTGMDGIFPPDLLVAMVTKVYPKLEGEFSYSLEAEPMEKNLLDLRQVLILPKNSSS